MNDFEINVLTNLTDASDSLTDLVKASDALYTIEYNIAEQEIKVSIATLMVDVIKELKKINSSLESLKKSCKES